MQMKIPGAFLHAENDEDVIMFVRGRLAELMTKIAPQTYRKYVTNKKGHKVLCVKVQPALYGMLKHALSFYKKLRNDLESIGFKVNPYDSCITNNVMNGEQMTIMA